MPALRQKPSSTKGGMTEQIEHIALGVVANISAWNYPWFVSRDVFVPALLTGNAVLCKPSGFAAMTGLAIARLLYAAAVLRDIYVSLIGGTEVGSAVLAQKSDGLFFTGSHSTGAKIAQALGPRLIKLQLELELGGKDPTYICDDANIQSAAASLADGAITRASQLDVLDAQEQDAKAKGQRRNAAIRWSAPARPGQLVYADRFLQTLATP